jgi:hypothetical protein
MPFAKRADGAEDLKFAEVFVGGAVKVAAATGAGDLAAGREVGEFDRIPSVRVTQVHGPDSIRGNGRRSMKNSHLAAGRRERQWPASQVPMHIFLGVASD